MSDTNRSEEVAEKPPPHIVETLFPLVESDPVAARPGVRSDYALQLQEMMETHRRCRAAEQSFAEAYSQVIALEKAIASSRQCWQT